MIWATIQHVSAATTGVVGGLSTIIVAVIAARAWLQKRFSRESARAKYIAFYQEGFAAARLAYAEAKLNSEAHL